MAVKKRKKPDTSFNFGANAARKKGGKAGGTGGGWNGAGTPGSGGSIKA